MIREEEIENMATYYAELVDKEYDISPLRKRIVKNAYWAGANWADEHPNLESLWHETTTQPELNEWFIAQIGDDAFDTFVMSMTNNKDWKNWSNGINMKRWAYVRNLLPKQFRNSEQLKGGKK